MKRLTSIAALLALLAAATTQADERAEIMANTCAGCHGTGGAVENSAFMPLAGLPADVFLQTMIDFRSGKRDSTLMRGVALGYTDEEIKAMAEFFAAQPMGGEK